MVNTRIPAQPNVMYPAPSVKSRQSRVIRSIHRQAEKMLPGFVIKTHFNPGGIAVFGETYAKIYRETPDGLLPVIEAYDTSMGMLVRQWDGRNSGANHYVQTLAQYVQIISDLAFRPFVRF